MACSDNVVRAGLTPKHKDVATLCQLVDCASFAPDELLFAPRALSTAEQLYAPPIADFAVALYRLDAAADAAADKQLELRAIGSASLAIVLELRGEATARLDSESKSDSGSIPVPLAPGTVLFIGADRTVSICLSPSGQILIGRAFCPEA